MIGRKQRTEDADLLRLMEQRMIAIELAGEGIGIVDTDGIIDFANKVMADMYGYDSWQDIIGLPWEKLTTPEERQKIRYEIIPTLRVQKRWSGQSVSLRCNGETFCSAITISGLPDGRWIFLVRDITDQVRLQEIAQNRLAAIEAAGDGIGLVDPQGNLIYMNKALKILHEFNDNDERDYIGHHWSNLYTEQGKEQIRNDVMPLLGETGYWKGESSMLTKSGRVIFAEMSLTMLEDGGMIGTARNITDRIAAERERKELEKQFYQAQKMEAVGRLVGGIAHDFNNLLASMMGYADFLMDDLTPGTRDHHFAKSIYEGGIQARQVIDRLLTFSRVQEHEVKCIDAKGLIENSINLIRPGLNPNISIQFDSDDQPVLSGDDALISQAMMNLLVNARDAIGDQAGTITLSMRSRTFAARDHLDGVLSGQAEEGLDYVEISVKDTGCGMNKILLDHIFDPFFTTKPVDKGTGLGLASVHGIMQAHKGAVYVTSTPEKGAEFRLYFPVCPEDKIRRMVNQCQSLPDASAFALTGVRIMLVEDMDDVRNMMQIMLERTGARVDSYPDGLAAQAALRGEGAHYDLVVTDQTMPGMCGLDLARYIHEVNPSIPVILTSGYTQDNLAGNKDVREYVQAIIKKPVDRKQLFEAIELCLKAAVPAAAIETAAPFPPPSGNQGSNQHHQA